jgi:hypothetical protein
MGNVDDAVSITIAIVIILTGPYSFLALMRPTEMVEKNSRFGESLSKSTVLLHHFSWLRIGTTPRAVT